MLQKPRNTAELSQSRTSELGTLCNESRNSTPAEEEVRDNSSIPWEMILPSFVPVLAGIMIIIHCS